MRHIFGPPFLVAGQSTWTHCAVKRSAEAATRRAAQWPGGFIDAAQAMFVKVMHHFRRSLRGSYRQFDGMREHFFIRFIGGFSK